MDRFRVLSHIDLPLLRSVEEAFPDVELIPLSGEGNPPPDASGEVLITQTWGAANLARVLPLGVKWVHTFGTGVNRFPFDLLGGRVLTCSRGASAVPIAEWVLATMLAFEKHLPDAWISEPPERWNVAELGGLYGRNLALVGFGGIARGVATRALAFGMHVRALRRTPAPSDIPGVEIVDALPALLGWADHLVIAAPSTAATRHLLDRGAFQAVKPGVHLVNIARGDLVDQDALRGALDSARVALASLDTVTPEPLPEGHWLYSHERVRLSPHVSWSMPGAVDGLVAPFVENLRRWRAGEPLDCVVDPQERY